MTLKCDMYTKWVKKDSKHN